MNGWGSTERQYEELEASFGLGGCFYNPSIDHYWPT